MKKAVGYGSPNAKVTFKFKYWNYSVITSVRSVEKALHTLFRSQVALETKNLANFKYKKDRNCRKIVIIKLDLDTPTATPSFNLTFRLQVITRKPII